MEEELQPKEQGKNKKGKWGKTVKVSLGVLGGLSLLMGYISATGMSQAEGEAEARKAIDDFIASLNARDQESARSCLHFPHVQITGKETRIWNSPEEFNPEFDSVSAAEAWHHSKLDFCMVRQNSADKVHFEIQFGQYNADGARVATYQSFWIVTRVGIRWGVQARSTLPLQGKEKGAR